MTAWHAVPRVQQSTQRCSKRYPQTCPAAFRASRPPHTENCAPTLFTPAGLLGADAVDALAANLTELVLPLLGPACAAELSQSELSEQLGAALRAFLESLSGRAPVDSQPVAGAQARPQSLLDLIVSAGGSGGEGAGGGEGPLVRRKAFGIFSLPTDVVEGGPAPQPRAQEQPGSRKLKL